MVDVIELLKERAARGTLVPDMSWGEGPFPPMSEEAILSAEAQLGFDLPETLRRIYREVANGGFGPAYGLLGLRGGMLNEESYDAVAQYEAYRQVDPDDIHWHWPVGLLPVGHLGCAMYCCIDCTRPEGSVIWFEPNPHEGGESWEDSFIQLAASTDQWIAAWLEGNDLFDKLVEGEKRDKALRR